MAHAAEVPHASFVASTAFSILPVTSHIAMLVKIQASKKNKATTKNIKVMLLRCCMEKGVLTVSANLAVEL